MSDVIAFPRRLYDSPQLQLWTLSTENAALVRRASMPTARAKSLADQIADLCRSLRHEIEASTPPGGDAA